jgi:hypothetical protein
VKFVIFCAKLFIIKSVGWLFQQDTLQKGNKVDKEKKGKKVKFYAEFLQKNRENRGGRGMLF